MTPDEMREMAEKIRQERGRSQGMSSVAWLNTAEHWKMVAELCDRFEWLKPLVFVPEDSMALDDLVNAKPGSIIRTPSTIHSSDRFCQDPTGCIWDSTTREWIVRTPGCARDHCEEGMKF